MSAGCSLGSSKEVMETTQEIKVKGVLKKSMTEGAASRKKRSTIGFNEDLSQVMNFMPLFYPFDI
jgi:hypothetical protein